MHSYEQLLIVFESISGMSGEDRTNGVKAVIPQFEAFVHHGDVSGVFSSNETLHDLNEDTIPYLLARYQLAKLLEQRDKKPEARLQSLIQARLHYEAFLDTLRQYRDPDAPASDIEEKDPAELAAMGQQARMRYDMVNRERKIIRFRKEKAAREAARAAMQELQSKGNEADRDAAFRALLEQAKYDTEGNIQCLLQEIELLDFEINHPDEAAAALSDYQRAKLLPGKAVSVQLNPNDVDKLARSMQGKKSVVPLDTVELLKLEDAKKATQGRQEQRVEINQHDFDFKQVDLVYGGGNPYTYEIKGEPQDHRDREYRVVRTDTFQPGRPKEEEPDIHNEFLKEQAGVQSEDLEENYDTNEKRSWDDWKDENPAGYGNKPRLV